MTDYAALERRYNGPIPQDELDALWHGSVKNKAIADIEGLIEFHEEYQARMLASAPKWLTRGNRAMHDDNIATAEFHGREISKLKSRLFDLRSTKAAVKGAGRFFDTLSPKEPDDA